MLYDQMHASCLIKLDLASGKHTYLLPDLKWDIEEWDLSDDGKQIAYLPNDNGVSTLHAVDVAMRKMLLKVGLEPKRDYVMIEAPLPTMRAMLAEKKADLVPLVVPFSFDPELRRIAKPLFYNRDVMGLTQLLFWCARQPFIDRNRAAMVDFMEDALRITYWFLDPANHAEVVAIASRLTKQPPERLGWVFTKQDYYHVPGMRPDLDALQRNVALIKELGLISADTDVKKYSDLTVLGDAAKRLK